MVQIRRHILGDGIADVDATDLEGRANVGRDGEEACPRGLKETRDRVIDHRVNTGETGEALLREGSGPSSVLSAKLHRKFYHATVEDAAYHNLYGGLSETLQRRRAPDILYHTTLKGSTPAPNPKVWKTTAIRVAHLERIKKWLEGHLAAHPGSNVTTVSNVVDTAVREWLDAHGSSPDLEPSAASHAPLQELEDLINGIVQRKLREMNKGKRDRK